MNYFKRIISFLLSLTIVFSLFSCKKKFPFSSYETKDAYFKINYEYGKHQRHYLDLAIPKNAVASNGIILYIHGGSWVGGDKEVYLDTLKRNASLGYISASINYRYADSKKVTCEDILDDIDMALAEIKKVCLDYGYDVNKLMVTGGSAGAHLSLMYAYTRADTAPITPTAVVSYAGPTDLSDPNFFRTQYVDDLKNVIYMVSGANITKKPVSDCKEQLLLASPISYVDSDTVPTLLCHGMKDDVVPYSNATTLYNILQQHGVKSELITYPNSGHGLEADSDKSDYSDKMFYTYAEEYLK